ncbi:ganglioside GM2 activator-like [Stigmatopora nigra]
MKTVAMLALSMLGVVVLGESQHDWREINNAKVSKFSWENCGTAEEVVLNTLSVSPDPINIPGRVTVSASGNMSVELRAPLNVKVILKKSARFFWWEVPCKSNVGSCYYPNICDILNHITPPGNDCPEPLHTNGLPCHCPFESGFYKLPPTDFTVPAINFPSSLTNGDYKIEVHLSDDKKELGCLKATLSVHAE